jgi:DNA repair protein RadC
MHNHPSGDPSPSRQDEVFTRRLIEAAELMDLRFLDHVVVGSSEAGRRPYYSFREAGIIV